MASITSIDYVGNYRPKNKAIKRGIPYNSLTMTDIETAEALKNKVSLTSVAKGDFKGFSPADTKRMYFEANDANANNLTFLTTHHFSYGDDNLQLKRDGTKICNNADAVVVVAPKNASRLKETSFETTLSNTITRLVIGRWRGVKRKLLFLV